MFQIGQPSGAIVECRLCNKMCLAGDRQFMSGPEIGDSGSSPLELLENQGAP